MKTEKEIKEKLEKLICKVKTYYHESPRRKQISAEIKRLKWVLED